MTLYFKSPEVAGIARCLAYWYVLAKKLEKALHQAYLDGGCREDEATEMVGAFFDRDHDGRATGGDL